MLIGTAGHIDHGKTTLIRALTGVNTDRLPEEQRRGISIDLGYAYLSTPTGHRIGFIDVPGHERFVPTMLAGATGIAAAVLVVAADDGPMPQTREHLDILQLLGVRHLCVALTKIDRADTEQRQAAEQAVQALLAATPFADVPVFPVAAPTGEGLPALRDALFSWAAAPGLNVGTAPLARLAIDRSFAIAGAGTVVTGTLHAGRIAVGDTLQLAKKSDDRRQEVRVRSLHANNQAATEATAGIRCALNLVGIHHTDAERGDWIVSSPLLPATAHLDVLLHPLPGSEKLLRPGSTLHIHQAAQHLMGRLVPLEPESHLWQIVTERPLLACAGDRLILRDPSARHTLGGACVLDPAAPTRHRQSPQRLTQLRSLLADAPASRLQALVANSPAGVDLHAFRSRQNTVLPDTLPDTLPGAQSVAGTRWLFSAEHLGALQAHVIDLLGGYHTRHPDELGLERDRLRRIAAPALAADAFAALLAQWKSDGTLAQSGALWHLPSHRVELDAGEEQLAERLLPMLLESPFDPLWVRDLAARLSADDAAVRGLLRKLAAQGQAFQIVRDLFFHRDAVRQLAKIIERLGLPAATGIPATSPAPVKAAALRDAIGGGRKRAIQILEFFDRVGYTRRIGTGQQQAHTLRGEPPVL